jgi:hypothetical protein
MVQAVIDSSFVMISAADAVLAPLGLLSQGLSRYSLACGRFRHKRCQPKEQIPNLSVFGFLCHSSAVHPPSITRACPVM